MIDARFEDARGGPLRLRALDADDLQIVSSIIQDSVLPITEMRWDSRRRRFGVLLNRLRRENRTRDEVERVRSILVVEDVIGARSQGIDRADRDTILQLLAVSVELGPDGGGCVTLILAGDGAVALDVETLEVTLRDVSRPYRAPSGKLPDHGA